jgi:hypothetical protein
MGVSSMTLATEDTQLSVKGDENLMGTKIQDGTWMNESYP